MGRRGPVPKPTPLLRLTGSRRANKRAKVEPKPPSGKPRVPADLSTDCKRQWRKVVEHLDGLGVLARIDEAAIERYVRMLVRWRALQNTVELQGGSMPVLAKDGRTLRFVPTPEASEAHKLGRALLDLEREFGLTPSARARLGIELSEGAKERQADAGRMPGFTCG